MFRRKDDERARRSACCARREEEKKTVKEYKIASTTKVCISLKQLRKEKAYGPIMNGEIDEVSFACCLPTVEKRESDGQGLLHVNTMRVWAVRGL